MPWEGNAAGLGAVARGANTGQPCWGGGMLYDYPMPPSSACLEMDNIGEKLTLHLSQPAGKPLSLHTPDRVVFLVQIASGESPLYLPHTTIYAITSC